MDIRELRAFVAVVEEGGLSAAARRLHVSQSALSQTVQNMERQLGVLLLTRSHAGVRPTDAGELLVREARGLLEQHDRLVETVRDLGRSAGAGTSGVLRIGVPLEFPTELLPAALGRLAESYPDTRVEVRHSSSVVQLDALRARELDIALVRDRPADPGLDAVLAVQESMGVIVSADRADRLAEPGGVALQRLAGLDWVGFARSDTPAWHDQVAATLRAHGITVADRFRTDDRPVTAEVKLAVVATGRAFALASPGWAQPLPAGLAWQPLVGDPIVRRTWAVWRAAARQRDLAVLIDALDLAARPPAPVTRP